MALTILPGAAGSGKTTELLENLIREAVENPSESYLLLVPEQFCFQTQRRLVELHPRHALLNVEALSFDRLATRVFRELNAESKNVLSATSRAMLLALSARSCTERLIVYKNLTARPGFLMKLGSLFAEWDMNDISPERLQELSEESAFTPLLRQKLYELSQIYEDFRTRLGKEQATAEETMPRLARLLPLTDVGRADHIYLDGFTGFTSVQYRILTTLLSRCRDMTAAVTIPPEEIDGSGNLFGMSREMIRRLIEAAAFAGKKTFLHSAEGKASLRREEETPDLAFLEAEFLRGRSQTYSGTPEHIRLYSCRDAASEAQRCVAEICRLVREKGLRYRDIAVIVSDQDLYGPLLEQAFLENAVPYFTDRREPLARYPEVRLLEAAMDTLVSGFDRDAVLRYLKNPFGPLSAEESDFFENYLLAAGIRRGRQFTSPFTRLPKRHRGERPDDYEERAERERNKAEELRIKTIEPLLRLRERIPARTKAASAAAAVSSFLEELSLEDKLKEITPLLTDAGLALSLPEEKEVREAIAEMLRSMAENLGHTSVSRREFSDLLAIGLSSLTLGQLPSAMDEIMIGDVLRSRFGNVRALIFLGMNEGKVPAEHSGGGLITDAERTALSFFEQDLGYTEEKSLTDERFYLYSLLAKPTSQLILCCSKIGNDGKSILPSRILREISRLFPDLPEEDGDSYTLTDRLTGLTEARRMLAVSGGENTVLREVLAAYPEERPYLNMIGEGRNFFYAGTPLNADTARDLYGTELSGNISRLESFAECPFRHFAAYGLKLEEREELDWDARDHGTFFHAVLQKIYENLRKEKKMPGDLSEAERARLVEQSLEAAEHDLSADGDERLPGYEYYRSRWSHLLQNYLAHAGALEAEGGFVPALFEKYFDARKNSGLRIPLQDGASLNLSGIIDRLDLCEKDNEKYYRIVDYKTGSSSEFDYNRIRSGQLLQLPLYLHAAASLTVPGEKDRNLQPGGMYYAYLTENWTEWKEEKDREKAADNACGLKGVTAEEVKEFGGGSPAIPSAVLGKLGRFARLKAAEIGERILDGEIEASPARYGGRSACEYCNCRNICRFDKKLPGYRENNVRKDKAEDAFRDILDSLAEKEAGDEIQS